MFRNRWSNQIQTWFWSIKWSLVQKFLFLPYYLCMIYFLKINDFITNFRHFGHFKIMLRSDSKFFNNRTEIAWKCLTARFSLIKRGEFTKVNSINVNCEYTWWTNYETNPNHKMKFLTKIEIFNRKSKLLEPREILAVKNAIIYYATKNFKKSQFIFRLG